MGRLEHEYERISSLLSTYRAELRSEIPTRLHSGVDNGGAPEFTAEFMRWLMRSGRRHHDDMLPVTKALRELRKVAPREYDVVSRRLAGLSVSEIQAWMQTREKVSQRDVAVLLIAGVSKMETWITTIWA